MAATTSASCSKLPDSRRSDNCGRPTSPDRPRGGEHQGAPENPAIRADMVFFETPGGGAVWSTGSIAWSGSLSHAGYQNNVSRITANVARRFVDPASF